MFEKTDRIFFAQTGMDRDVVTRIVEDALVGADDGELFLEYSASESLVWDDGCLKNAVYDSSHGFGLRSVAGEATGYAHAGELSEDAIRRAASTVQAISHGYGGAMDMAPHGTNSALYVAENPLEAIAFEQKVALLEQVDIFARSYDSRVVQVQATISGSWQAIQILRADGWRAADIRPLVRMNVMVVMEDGGRQERGTAGHGGRYEYARILNDKSWQNLTKRAIKQAAVNLQAKPAPAGEMTVVLGSGWPGVLLHEAVGHGLEGDFNRKETSVFSGRIGERVAAPGVSVIDDGTIHNRRGSLTIDDEGTPSRSNVLIEDGVLVGYLQDRMNARLMGMKPTGNGRRENYACQPMPRMTNTYMKGGEHDPNEVIASVKDGLYAVDFSGGQVDITSGKFVFSTSEAYLIKNGRIDAPVRGATLIGNGPEVMRRVGMIGNDMSLDSGIGGCGKAGQWVPVGVGQPTLRIDGLTVGGTG